MASGRRSIFGRMMAILAVLLIAATGLGYLYWPQLYALIEDELVYATKAEHWALYSTGQTLPGTPDLEKLQTRLAERNMKLGSPLFMRVFKREFELEVWMQRGGRFELFATYPICMWSGGLGPKLKQGDRQAPEGFYTVDASALNPNSQYHRSFNLGYPNAFDRAHGRTGSLLMVHGDCRSVGCYAMTNPGIAEIWTLLTAALEAGQKRVQVQAFPFRPSATNMSLHAHNADLPFWQQLQVGYDVFNRTGTPPLVSVCNGRYVVRPGPEGNDGSATIDTACPAT